MEALIFEFLELILKDVIAPDALSLTEDSLSGSIKAAPVVMVDAATLPTLDHQVAADLAAYEAGNKV